MPLKGAFAKGSPITILVASSPFAPTGLTIIKINQRGGMNARSLTFAPGQSADFTELLGQRIVRMILLVTPPVGGAANVAVVQGTTQYADQLTGDAELVFDAV